MFAMWFSSRNDAFLCTHKKEKSWMIASLSLVAEMSEQYTLIVDRITQQTFLFSPIMHSHTIMVMICVNVCNWFTTWEQNDKLHVTLTIFFLQCMHACRIGQNCSAVSTSLVVMHGDAFGSINAEAFCTCRLCYTGHSASTREVR